MFDPTWGMPAADWGQTGSFIEAASPPSLGPLDGTLVQLPCINEDWLPLVLGALDQLRNPSSWLASLTDSQRNDVLGQVNELRSAFGMAINVPCCNVAMQLTSNCGLQFSTDGGSTWHDVQNWGLYFGQCVRSNQIQPIPPNPRHDVIQQHACNIAGFISSKFIQLTMQKIVSYVGTTNEQVQFARDVSLLIQYAFPITYVATTAFFDFYNYVVGQLLAEVSAASTDATLWSDVTCAIYNAIKNDGYVTAGNFASVHTNLTGIVYVYPWAITAISNYWNDVGLQTIQQLQNVGAIDDVDCTSCGVWCEEWDFTVSPGPWLAVAGQGTWVAGQGWVGQNSGGQTALYIYLPLSPALSLTDMFVEFTTSGSQGGAVRHVFGVKSGGGNTTPVNMDSGVHNTPYITPGLSIGALVTEVDITLDSISPGQTNVILKANINGNGPNPFGLNNCTIP